MRIYFTSCTGGDSLTAEQHIVADDSTVQVTVMGRQIPEFCAKKPAETYVSAGFCIALIYTKRFISSRFKYFREAETTIIHYSLFTLHYSFLFALPVTRISGRLQK